MNFNTTPNFSIYKNELIYTMLKNPAHFSVFFSFNRDPNKEPGEERGLDDWPLHTYKEREYIVLDTAFHDHNRKPTVDKAFKVDKCAFWLEYVPTLMQTTGIAELSSLKK